MNNEQTIKAVTPILTSYFRGETTAEAALDLIGPIFKANSTAPQAAAAGYRVIDPEGGAHEYPDAIDAFPNRTDLILTGEKGAPIAIFHRWEHVERIA